MTPIEVRYTINDRAVGDDIAQGLLDRRLVACWQRRGPFASHYWWEGRQETADEWLYAAKTTDTLLDEVVEAIGERHPYEVPEVIAVALVGGRLEYLDWIVSETEHHHAEA
ncbi:MAG: divalent-cation tolerance protein CutA [Acidimicrobiales bacterium]|nr:divalent-cation tolerance protein CutA [Actinomycetota bacterium]